MKPQEIKMNNECISFVGPITNVKWIPTRTGRQMIKFKVGDKACVAFDEVAESFSRAVMDGEVNIRYWARTGQYLRKPQYVVFEIEPIKDLPSREDAQLAL